MSDRRKKLEEIKKQKESGISPMTVLQNKMQEDMKKKYQINEGLRRQIEEVA